MDFAPLSLRLPLEGELRVMPHAATRRPDDAFAAWSAAADELAGLIRALGIAGDGVGDVLQDLYLSVVESLPAGLTPEEARRWLFRVAVNRCRLEQRQRSRWQRLLAGWAVWQSTTTPPATTGLEQHELTTQVDAALGRLKLVEREVVVLRYFCGLNSREVGEALQMPEATVRSHLAKARRQLARDLADWDEKN